jgi:hypothetical protein
MSPSGMWRCVGLVLTDVSEECIASIFRVEKSASEEPVWPGDCRRQLTEDTQRHIPEDDILHSHRCKRLKSYTDRSPVCTFHIVFPPTVSIYVNRGFINILHTFLFLPI